jgi:hypothetical protein
VELSAKVRLFHPDVDRCLKKSGIDKQYDFGHFPENAYFSDRGSVAHHADCGIPAART